MGRGRAVCLGFAAVLNGCVASGPVPPASLDVRNDTCAFCRMYVSDAALAAQIVARGEEPRFFDDIGCLAAYLRAHPHTAGATAYVADHRTHAWVAADRAVYSRVPTLDTPMGSHLIAHEDAASRDADSAVTSALTVSASAVFGRDAGLGDTP